MAINKDSFYQQLRMHSVAIVSLITALCGFFYNTWQDQQNEEHLNMRNASFEVLKNLGELQSVVNYGHYEPDNQKGNPIEGWKYVILVRDLSQILPEDTMKSSQSLFDVWTSHWSTLMTEKASEHAISEEIALVRSDVLKTIQQLR